MPWGDWQFWVVSAAAIIALTMLLRPFFPLILGRGRTRGSRTQLTVKGSRVDRRKAKQSPGPIAESRK